MSTRAIAPVVGANYATVSRDIKESVASATDTPRTVQSNDGITRTFQPRPEPNTWEEPQDAKSTTSDTPIPHHHPKSG